MLRLHLPDGVPAGIEVYRLDYQLATEPRSADWQVLSAAEQARAQRFHRLEDRCRAVRTRACLRRLLGERQGRAPAGVRIEADAYGKPSSPDGGVYFNVSHSGALGLIALSALRPVGVDIEQQGDGADGDAGAGAARLAGLAALVYSPAERRTPLEGGVLAHWVAKEAVLKALGVGLSEPLAALTVGRSMALASGPAAAGGGTQYQLTHERPDWPPLALWPLDVERGYRAALALA
jgi:4'-phosphopantetheinyl transferase